VAKSYNGEERNIKIAFDQYPLSYMNLYQLGFWPSISMKPETFTVMYYLPLTCAHVKCVYIYILTYTYMCVCVLYNHLINRLLKQPG